MTFIVEQDIDITDFKVIQAELDRLNKQFGFVKAQVSNAEKGVNDLAKTEQHLTTNIDDQKQ